MEKGSSVVCEMGQESYISKGVSTDSTEFYVQSIIVKNAFLFPEGSPKRFTTVRNCIIVLGLSRLTAPPEQIRSVSKTVGPFFSGCREVAGRSYIVRLFFVLRRGSRIATNRGWEKSDAQLAGILSPLVRSSCDVGEESGLAYRRTRQNPIGSTKFVGFE